MNLEDLKDQLKEQAAQLWGELQESSAYNSLREQYENMPSSGQKLLQIGGVLLAIFMLLLIPLSYFDSAATKLADFEENRSLVRDMLRASRDAQQEPPLPPGLTAMQLQSQVDNALRAFNLLNEQRGGVTPLGPNPAEGLVPASIEQQGLRISLKKLNLRQLVDIGYRLQSIHPGVRMTSLEVQANTEDNHYFDVLFSLVSLSLPQPSPPEEG